MANLTGTSADDTITAESSDDYLDGKGGNDLLIGGAQSYGGNGNDTLESGSVIHSSQQVMAGGADDDLFVINYDANAGGDRFSISIDGGSGNDTLDLSAVTSSASNIFIFGEQYHDFVVIYIYDDDRNYLGQIDLELNRPITSGTAKSLVETLIVGDQTFDLTQGHYGNEIYSRAILGANDFGNNLTSGLSGAAILGFDGNDTLTGGAGFQKLQGGDGNDILSTGGNDALWLIGGADADTYIISWQVTAYSYTGYRTNIRDGGASEGDVIDLSNVVSSFNDIGFEFGSNHLLVQVYNTDGSLLGVLNINDQMGSLEMIDTLVIGDSSLELPYSSSAQTYIDLLAAFTAEVLTGSEGNDRLTGKSGNDRLLGFSGNDSLFGGRDNDTLSGGEGRDLLDGGDGNDQLWAGAGDVGRDTMIGGNGDDSIGGGAGNDILIGDATSGTDTSGFGADVIFGGSGNDQIVTGGWLDDGNGQIEDGERLNASNDANVAYGGSGNDKIWGTAGSETLAGGADHDLVFGHFGDDVLYGGKGAGNDTLHGNGGEDTIYGGAGDDRILGGIGSDLLFNGTGDDTVEGGGLDDTLYGGAGDDFLSGDEGADLFSFAAGHGHDTVTDFDPTEDLIRIAGFTADEVLQNAESATAQDQSGLLITIAEATSVFLIGMTANDIADAILDG